MKKSIALAAALAVGTVAFSSSGEAGDRGWGRHGGHHMGMGMHHGKRFGRMMAMERFHELADLDGDGTITRTEIDEVFSERFAEYDANGDGALDIDEFDQWFREITRPMMVRTFQFLDREGAGALEEDYLKERLDRMVSRLDRNGDGEISREDRRRGGHHRGERPQRDRMEQERGDRGDDEAN